MSGTRQQAAVGSQQGRHGTGKNLSLYMKQSVWVFTHTATGSMFAFRKRWDNIDWRALGK